MLERHASRITGNGEAEITVETALGEGDDVGNTVVCEAGDGDLVLVGAAREGLLRRRLFGGPAIDGRRAPQPADRDAERVL